VSPLNLYARVRVFVHVLHTRPRVQRAPGFPCALCLFARVKGYANLGHLMPREWGPVPHLSIVDKILYDDVGFRQPRSSFRCQADKAYTRRQTMRVMVLVKATDDSDEGLSR
jgi:hypothetical protein